MAGALLALLAGAVVGSAPAQAATYTVGNDAACTHSTLQAAINAASPAGTDLIRVASNQSYTGQTLTIGSQDLIIQGGYSSCSATSPDTGSTTIAGTNATMSSPVFTITGSGVRRLENLIITRGNATNEGGGINFSGTGELRLNNVSVYDNWARWGGGINFKADGGEAHLTLGANTLVWFNEAWISGGGLRIDGGDAVMTADEDRIWVYQNIAHGIDPNTGDVDGGYGGGVEILNGATANIGSPGYGAAGVIDQNAAQYGGGVAVLHDSELNLYTTVADRPVTLSNNTASHTGGAIHVDPDGWNTPYVVINHAYLHGNSAANGAAIYSDTDTDIALDSYGARIYWNIPSNAAGIACTPNVGGCDLVEDNQITGSPMAGATILLQNDGVLHATGITFSNNRAQNLIRVIDNYGLWLDTVLIAANSTDSDLIRLNFGDKATIEEFRARNLTIAGNAIGGSNVFTFEDGPDELAFNNNLIWQPGKTVVSLPFPIANSSNYNWDYNSGAGVGILPPPWNAPVDDARFVNPYVNDYRLLIGSQLVDYNPGSAVDATQDLDGRTRKVDQPIIDSSRILDVGAFERQVSDPWIADGGFGSTLDYWRPEARASASSFTTWNAADANGATNSGSALYNNPSSSVTEDVALTHCFQVPGPGRYQLHAKSKSTGSNLNTDYGRLSWNLRASDNTGIAQSCTGPVTTFGNALFNGTPNTGGWRSVSDTFVEVPSETWNYTTTIELRLDVLDGAITSGTGVTNVYFDDVQVTGTVLDDVIFRDGFES